MKEVDVLNVILKWCNKIAGFVLKGLPNNQTFGIPLK